MSMLDKSCAQFVEVLASKAPVPGGGGAAAFGGALGMALTNMVGNLTVGKKKYAEVEPEVKDLLDQGYAIIAQLQQLVDKDAEVFEPLSQAYGIPKDDPTREATLEKCSKDACSIPLEILRNAYKGIVVTRRVADIGSLLVISDAGCGVSFLKAALISAKLNIVINLGTIKDEEYVRTVQTEMDGLVSDGIRLADETLEIVLGKISK